MFIERNPHPQQKRVADCVKRAIVLSAGINYHDVAIMLNRYKAETGAKQFNSREHWKDFVVNVLGAYDLGNMQFANNGTRYTVKEFARLRKNPCICKVAKHLTTCDGLGNYLDTWDCGEKYIYKVYATRPYAQTVERIRKYFPKLCKGLTLAKQ